MPLHWIRDAHCGSCGIWIREVGQSSPLHSVSVFSHPSPLTDLLSSPLPPFPLSSLLATDPLSVAVPFPFSSVQYLSQSSLSQPSVLVVTQGLLFALGGAILYAPVISWMNEWWIHRRGLAYGVITAGTSISGIVFPFIIESLLRRFGSGPTLWGLGIVLFVLIGSLLPFVKGRLPVPPKIEEERHETSFDYSFLWGGGKRTRTFWILWMVSRVIEFFPVTRR
jgi:MFS family permease